MSRIKAKIKPRIIYDIEIDGTVLAHFIKHDEMAGMIEVRKGSQSIVLDTESTQSLADIMGFESVCEVVKMSPSLIKPEWLKPETK